MKTLTLAPYKHKKNDQNQKPISSWNKNIIKNNKTLQSQNKNYHGFRRKVRLELSTNDTAVTVRPGDLSPDAPIVGPILLHLGLVDVRQSLPAVPIHLLLGVHSLHLDQRRVWVLVRFRPNHQPKSESKIKFSLRFSFLSSQAR